MLLSKKNREKEGKKKDSGLAVSIRFIRIIKEEKSMNEYIKLQIVQNKN